MSGKRSRVANKARQLGRKLTAVAAVYAESKGLTDDRPLRGPVFALVSISDPCNHRCVMCLYHPPEKPAHRKLETFAGERPGVMSMETFRPLADELSEMGTLQLDLVGRGEPLLNPACVEMVRYAVGRGLEVSLTTNGSRLNEERADGLVAAGLHRMKVSLNAGLSETYPLIHVTETPESHRAVVANIRTLVEKRDAAKSAFPRVTLSFTIVRANAQELESMLDRVKESGADAAWFQHVIDDAARPGVGLDAEQVEKLRSETIPKAIAHARRLGVEHNLQSFAKMPPPGQANDEAGNVVPCYVGSYFTSVLGNGEVAGCCQIYTSLGSVKDGGFARVWKSDAYRDFRRAARALPAPSPVLETAECDRCCFRAYNRTIHAALHPLKTMARANSPELIPLRHLVRMTRTDRPE